MKNKLLYVIFSLALCLSGCSGRVERPAETPGEQPLTAESVMAELLMMDHVPTAGEIDGLLAKCDRLIAGDTVAAHRFDNYMLKIAILESQGRYVEAMDCRCEYVTIYPENHPARIIHRYYRERMAGDMVAARSSLAAVIESVDSMLAVGDDSAIAYKVEALMRLGRDDEAKRILADAADRYPDNANLSYYRDSYSEYVSHHNWDDTYFNSTLDPTAK